MNKGKDPNDSAKTVHQGRTPLKQCQDTENTAHTSQQAGAPVNKRQESRNTAHTTHQGATLVNKPEEAKDTPHTKLQARTPVYKHKKAKDKQDKAGAHTAEETQRHQGNRTHYRQGAQGNELTLRGQGHQTYKHQAHRRENYRQWGSYCCVALVFGFGSGGNPANPCWCFWCVCSGTGFWLLSANPGWSLRRVCLGLGLAFTTPILAVLFECVCLCARCVSIPPILAGVCGACVGARALPLPRQSWLGFVLSVFVFGFGFWLHPANSGWGDQVCLFVCAFRLYLASPGWSACTPSIRAGVCCARVCVWALGFSLHRQSWLGFVVCVSGFGICFQPANGWGVCVWVCAPPIPHHSWLAFLGFWCLCRLTSFSFGLPARLLMPWFVLTYVCSSAHRFP